MKKPVKYIIIITAGLIAGFLISSVIFTATGFSLFGAGKKENPHSARKNNQELISFALRAVDNIKQGDFQALSQIVHPELGVVFSPYATITLSTNKCFQAEQIALFGTDSKLYVWGVYAGSGEPIEMTAAGYFAEFVFDKDYTAAPVIGVNQIIKSGNALENISDVLPDAKFIDFHIHGNDKENGEDYAWSSLRLGFEEFEGNLWLTVILHSEMAE